MVKKEDNEANIDFNVTAHLTKARAFNRLVNADLQLWGYPPRELKTDDGQYMTANQRWLFLKKFLSLSRKIMQARNALLIEHTASATRSVAIARLVLCILH